MSRAIQPKPLPKPIANMMSIKRQHPSMTYIARSFNKEFARIPVVKRVALDGHQYIPVAAGEMHTRSPPLARNVGTSEWVPKVIPRHKMVELYNAFDKLRRRYSFERENTNGTNTKWADFIIARNKMIFMVQYYLALRPLEALAMEWTHILSPTQAFVSGENNKTKKSGVVEMPVQLYNALMEYKQRFVKTVHSKYIFPSFEKPDDDGQENRWGTVKQRNHVSRYRWGEIFHKAIIIAGLDMRDPKNPGRCMYTPYSLRHSRATHLLEDSNFDIFSVSNILRHASPSTTMTYLHATSSFRSHWSKLMSQNLPF